MVRASLNLSAWVTKSDIHYYEVRSLKGISGSGKPSGNDKSFNFTICLRVFLEVVYNTAPTTSHISVALANTEAGRYREVPYFSPQTPGLEVSFSWINTLLEENLLRVYPPFPPYPDSIVVPAQVDGGAA